MHDALLFLWPQCEPHKEEGHGSLTHTKGITCGMITHMHQTTIHSKFQADGGETSRAPFLDFLHCPRLFYIKATAFVQQLFPSLGGKGTKRSLACQAP